MPYTREELQAEITRRAPWYQCIEFPEQGITTTDDPANAMLDAAWDNKTDDITLAEAARLRPRPKWNAIKEYLPSVRGLDVLEIGSNCGFFSFEFARAGARTVTGLDVAPKWLENAEWVRSVLGHQNVRFQNCDFMRYDGTPGTPAGLLSGRDATIPLPNRLYDVVFMSTVLDHLFFPLFSIYKMCRISRQWVVIDSPVAPGIDPARSLAHLAVAPDNSHHGFVFSETFLRNYLGRLGVPAASLQVHHHNQGRNITYVIDVRQFTGSLHGA
jgi:SAM-dependent methyltransferase